MKTKSSSQTTFSQLIHDAAKKMQNAPKKKKTVGINTEINHYYFYTVTSETRSRKINVRNEKHKVHSRQKGFVDHSNIPSVVNQIPLFENPIEFRDLKSSPHSTWCPDKSKEIPYPIKSAQKRMPQHKSLQTTNSLSKLEPHGAHSNTPLKKTEVQKQSFIVPSAHENIAGFQVDAIFHITPILRNPEFAHQSNPKEQSVYIPANGNIQSSSKLESTASIINGVDLGIWDAENLRLNVNNIITLFVLPCSRSNGKV